MSETPVQEGPAIPRKISRDELYDMVWVEPLSKLSKKLGVSDVAVAKWCKKLGVPRPGRGYWAQVEAGQRPRRPPLPAPAKGQPLCVYPNRGGRRATPAGSQDEVPGMEAFSFPILVPDVAGVEHPLVAATRQTFEHATTDDNGLLKPRARKRLDISVSEASKDRALRIVNALVVAVEGAGHKVEIGGGANDEGKARVHMTFAIIDDERIQFALREKVERRQREPTAAERRKMERDYFFRGPFYEETTTGKLSLTIEGSWYGESHRRTWSDGKRQRVENCLQGFIRSLLLSAHSIKRRRREAEERKIREEQERIRREKRERQEREELKRRVALENASFAWEHAQRLRAFLAAVEEAAKSDTARTTESDTALADWLKWARWYADYLDPLTPADGVTSRAVAVSDDQLPSAGYRETMNQIGRHVESISRDLSALESRLRYGRGW